MLDLIEAQAGRISTQAEEIDRLSKAVQTLQAQKLEVERRLDEHRWKYPQLQLEARIGLWKVLIVALAVVVVAWILAALVFFKHRELAELLEASSRSEATVAAKSQASWVQTPAASGPAAEGASAAASAAK